MTTTTTYTVVGFTIAVEVTLTETSLNLSYLSATIDWGDGIATEVPRTLKTDDSVVVTVSHTYSSLGFFVIQVTGRNYKSPTYNTDLNIINLELGAAPIQVVNRGFLRGPILPADPMLGNWVFNTGSDILLVASDLRSLLLTKQGERLMLPDFGTNIHRLVFEPDTSLIEAQVQQEVSQAISRFEPRVTITSVAISRPQEKSLAVDVQVQALNQFFGIGLNFG